MGVMVQDGCDNACTYCIVHTARGHSVSRSADDVVAEVSAAATSGVQEVVLTGINIGSYQATDGVLTNLVTLLQRLLAETSIGRIRVSSIEPLDVTPNLVDAMVMSQGRICAHLHMPLQSGSDKVLSEMNRPYCADVYLQIIEHLRAKLPHISLTTDVIVGFPGESEQDFEETLSVCRAADFSKIHVFRYSRRAGTPAALYADQIDPAIKKERAQRLVALQGELRTLDQQMRLGSVEGVLIERTGLGKSESYHDVIDDGTWHIRGCEIGALMDMRLAGLDERGRFIGMPLDNV